MSIDLEKGDFIEIPYEDDYVGEEVTELKRSVCIGLGWDPHEGTGYEFDLDASAFLLGNDRQIPDQPYFVFYGNLKSPSDAVMSSGDDQTGGSSDGDDETLTIDFGKIDARVEEIAIVVTIHDFETRRQNFGQVRNSYIRIYDPGTEKEICKYKLTEDFSTETAVEFGTLSRIGGTWRFNAVGKGYEGGLQFFVSKYATRFA